uniref:Uncharacterized protein n=1 Tax=Setaria italica TaxID=4555 RepID=K3Z272_SETIT
MSGAIGARACRCERGVSSGMPNGQSCIGSHLSYQIISSML